MKNEKNKSWSWPLGIVLSLVIFAIFIVSVAVYISKQKFSLVSENYYPESMVYQDVINMKKATKSLAEQPSVKFMSSLEEVQIAFPPSYQLDGIQGKLHFYRPDNAKNDFEVDLKLDPNGQQIVPAKTMRSGYWKMQLTFTMNSINYLVEKDLFL